MQAIILIIVAIINLMMGGIILKVNHKDPININFFLFCLCLSLWTAIHGLANIAFYVTNINIARFLFRLIAIPAVFIPSLFVYFTQNFPKKTKLTKSFYFINAFIIILLLLFHHTDYHIHSIQYVNNKFSFKFGFFYIIFNLYVIVMILWGIITLVIKGFTIKEKEQKLQIIFLCLGGIICILIVLIFATFLPSINITKYNFLTPTGTIFFVALWAIAVIKFRFMHTLVIIGNILAYFITITFIILSFLLGIYYLPRNMYLIAGYTTIFGVFWAFAALPLKKLIITTTRHAFIKDYYDAQAVLAALSTTLNQAQTTDDVLNTVTTILDEKINFEDIAAFCAQKDNDNNIRDYKILKSINGQETEYKNISVNDKFIKHLLENKTTQLIKDFIPKIEGPTTPDFLTNTLFKEGIILPLHSAENMEGLIFLSKKSSDAAFSIQDIDFLNTIISIIVPVLERIKPYEEIKTKYEKTLAFAETVSRQASHSVLVRGVSHELNNALCIIKSRLKLMKYELGEKDSLTKSLDICNGGINRSFNILNRMMDYTKDQNSHRKESININPIIEEINAHLKPYIDDKDIQVKFELAKIPNIHADGNSIYQIIFNLVINAIQAIKDEGIITVFTREETFINKEKETKKGIVVQITDNGPGIPDKIKTQIFDPFYTTKYSANENQHLGLGLSIVLQVTNAHHGQVELISKEGEGTTFKVYLPVG
ncbi:ATP-binding protein [Candidatus Margulisiibacteriota bacterium]